MFVSLGGTMQIPVSQAGNPLAGSAYAVVQNTVTNTLDIVFAVAPAAGAACNIRVVASDEFLTCPLPAGLLDTSLKVGPGIEINSEGQIIGIDSELIQP